MSGDVELGGFWGAIRKGLSAKTLILVAQNTDSVAPRVITGYPISYNLHLLPPFTVHDCSTTRAYSQKRSLGHLFTAKA